MHALIDLGYPGYPERILIAMPDAAPDSVFKHPPETAEIKGSHLEGDEASESSNPKYVFNEQTNYVPRRTIITVSLHPSGSLYGPEYENHALLIQTEV